MNELNSNKKLVFKYSILLVGLSILSNSSSAQSAIEKNQSLNIDTTVDSTYVYEYEGSKYIPPNGKTILMVGQTLDEIHEYSTNFGNHYKPAGWSAYWAVTEFKGVRDTFITGSGDKQNHQEIVDQFPNSVIHSAMWMSGNWDVARNTGLGFYDDVIKEYGKWAKEINRPIFLRIGYEFDGPHNALEPNQYVRAYRRIVDIMREEGVENVVFVWHSYAAPTFKGYPVSDWYPGDEYVDWVGISVFYQPYHGKDLNKEGYTVLGFAKERKKPVMIAESNPVLGIEENDTEIWDSWFENFFSMTYKYNIRAIAIISQDWNKLTIEGIEEWEDSRLQNNKEVAEKWILETKKDRYLKQSSDLFTILGFDK